ncbi:MAG: hypothetical protein JO305_07455 [Alphaproteobacteria bacterium]|nr:hypothetical protein [Alphaproteobacteria bacterium]
MAAAHIVMFALFGIQGSRASQIVLSDPLTAWPLNFGPQSANVMLRDGAVHIVESGDAASWVTISGFNFADMDASVTITSQTASGNAAGLIFWATAPQDFFEFAIYDSIGSFGVTRRLPAGGGSWQILVPATKSAAVKSGIGAANTARIVTKGNAAALFINGQPVGNLDVQAPSGGGTVGIEGEGQAGQSADYVFSNLVVSQ